MCQKCLKNEGVRRAIVAALTSRVARIFQPKRPAVVDHLTAMLTIIAPPLGIAPDQFETVRAIQKTELQRYVDKLTFDEVYALGAAGSAMSSLFEVIESWASGSIARRAEEGDPEASKFVTSLPSSSHDEGVMVVAMPSGFGGGGDKPVLH